MVDELTKDALRQGIGIEARLFQREHDVEDVTANAPNFHLIRDTGEGHVRGCLVVTKAQMAQRRKPKGELSHTLRETRVLSCKAIGVVEESKPCRLRSRELYKTMEELDNAFLEVKVTMINISRVPKCVN